MPLAYEQPSLIISGEPPPGLSSPPPDEQPMVWLSRAVPASFTCRVPMRTPVQATATIWCWQSRT
jgi:hypothetical protein